MSDCYIAFFDVRLDKELVEARPAMCDFVLPRAFCRERGLFVQAVLDVQVVPRAADKLEQLPVGVFPFCNRFLHLFLMFCLQFLPDAASDFPEASSFLPDVPGDDNSADNRTDCHKDLDYHAVFVLKSLIISEMIESTFSSAPILSTTSSFVSVGLTFLYELIEIW